MPTGQPKKTLIMKLHFDVSGCDNVAIDMMKLIIRGNMAQLMTPEAQSQVKLDFEVVEEKPAASPANNDHKAAVNYLRQRVHEEFKEYDEKPRKNRNRNRRRYHN